MALPFDLSPLQALWVAAGLFGAAWVRGYSGFGFAALVILSASLVTNPLHFVPVVIVADFILTGFQARNIWPDIDWRRVGNLFAGCLLGVPAGVWVVSQIGVDQARIVISGFVLIMCVILWWGWTMARPAGRVAHVGAGIVSGLANGAAVGGLPVAAFFSAQPIRAATFRATLIAYFTSLDLWTLPNMMGAGMISRDTLIATAMGMPVLYLGLWLGGRQFHRAPPENFRRFAVALLAILALLGLIRAAL